jgi:hypothetical protein
MAIVPLMAVVSLVVSIVRVSEGRRDRCGANANSERRRHTNRDEVQDVSDFGSNHSWILLGNKPASKLRTTY